MAKFTDRLRFYALQQDAVLLEQKAKTQRYLEQLRKAAKRKLPPKDTY